MKHWEDSLQVDKWPPEVFLHNGFSMNNRTYVMKYTLYLHVADYEPDNRRSMWAPIHSDEYLPDGIMAGCRLWKKNDYGMPLYAFLDGMFGE